MDAYQFVIYAKAHNFTAEQVQKQFPGLPLHVCQALLTGKAFIDSIKPNGQIVVDDGED